MLCHLLLFTVKAEGKIVNICQRHVGTCCRCAITEACRCQITESCLISQHTLFISIEELTKYHCLTTLAITEFTDHTQSLYIIGLYKTM